MRLGVAAAVVDGSLVRGDVDLDDGRIVAIGLAGGGSGLAVPGLVDLQVNGFRGIDVLGATSDEIVALGVELARTGVLWYQPTLVTAPAELTRLALATIGESMDGSGARILGVHLEGPFLSRPSVRARIRSGTFASPTSTCSPRSSLPDAASRWSRWRPSSRVRAS